jgi:hypothetical protein
MAAFMVKEQSGHRAIWKAAPFPDSPVILLSYGTWNFIAVFTSTRFFFPISARWVRSTISHSISLRSVLILSSHKCIDFVRIFSLHVFPSKPCACFSSLLHVPHDPPIVSPLSLCVVKIPTYRETRFWLSGVSLEDLIPLTKNVESRGWWRQAMSVDSSEKLKHLY